MRWATCRSEPLSLAFFVLAGVMTKARGFLAR